MVLLRMNQTAKPPGAIIPGEIIFYDPVNFLPEQENSTAWEK